MSSKDLSYITKHATLDEADETLHAIRHGAVDAFVVEEEDGHRVYALEGADLPYSILVEKMQQGAVMLNAHGDIIYCNVGLANLLGVARETLIGSALCNHVTAPDKAACEQLQRDCEQGPCDGELRLTRADGTTFPANFSFSLLAKSKSAIGVLITDLTSQKQQAEFTSHLQRMQDDERKRIARELHDSVGQLLAAITMNVEVIRSRADKTDAKSASTLSDTAQLVDQVSREIRTISYLLHPPLLDVAGLASALRWFVDGFSERSAIKVELEISPDLGRLPTDMEIAIFRIIQECLTNVHRHSGSRTCSVKIIQDGGNVRVEVKDAGRGIPAAKLASGFSSGGVGFGGMRERVRQLGGTLNIESDENGSTVTAVLNAPRSGDATT
jgi:PAS domain S-box-containing protein